MPLEQASKQKEIVESVGKKRLFRKKTMDPTIVAAYRCACIFAINRYLGDAEAAAMEAAAAASKPATPSTLKLTHLTPMVGLVPIHLFVDSKLMAYIYKKWQEKQRSAMLKQDDEAEEDMAEGDEDQKEHDGQDSAPDAAAADVS
jgi:hypothetical protein